jgi:type 2 lantibiotic biosynthesis protein LanM
MTYSVLRVGLLPLRMYAGEDSEGIDLSGLGHAEGQMMPTEQPRWEHGGTDAMRLGRGRVELPTHKNRPTLAGQTVNPLDYIDAICAGFAATYQLLLEHRDTLLTENGLLARFADDEIRVIIRPTNVYGLMQRESFHPDVLRDGLDRDRFFDRLWVGINQRPSLAQLIPFERDDLENGDIPMFTTRPGSRDVWSSSGERITNFLPVSGLALAEQRVRQFSGDDLVRQMWFIRASLTAFARGTERSRDVVYAVAEPVAPAEPAQLIAAARAVADRLELLSLRGNQDVTWLGLTILKNNAWSLTQLGPDLYDGLPGIALFLAYLGDVTGENRYTALARTTLDTARQQFAGVQDVMASIGAFDGWGGWIYTLTHLGVLWRKPELLAEAEAVVGRLPQRIKQDRSFDVISGATGCLGALLNLYQVAPSEQTLEAAILCGEHLLTHSVTTPAGRAWNTPIASTAPLTGFSHGAAGMAWALLRLGALTGDERFRTAGLEAVAYERSRFSSEARNWPDLRDFSEIRPQAASEETPYMTAWCHGAMGIGLARLVTLPYLEPAETKAEIHAALHTTLEQGFGFNHSLCHGDLGNLDLLLHAGNVLRNAAWHDEARRLGGVILASIEHHGWLCGVPLAVETPGLMTGLAGIGYGLLRLAAPARVPSILTLAPPTS